MTASPQKTTTRRASGPDAGTIHVHVSDLRQLFNAIDPSPFRERDLDPGAEEFIVTWARELPRSAPPALTVHLDRAPERREEATLLGDAVHEYFTRQAAAARRELRALFGRGRVSLLIGLAFLAAAVGASQLIENLLHPGGMAQLFRESLLIGGWVAMWRPLEIFLYDWWPIRAEARLHDRLAAMPVELRYTAEGDSGGRIQDPGFRIQG